MKSYPKTYGPYSRFDGKEYHKYPAKVFGWAQPAFQYLKDVAWDYEEKLDGTGMRIIYDGVLKLLEVVGRTNKAEFPEKLIVFADDLLNYKLLKFIETFADNNITFYGEGIGSGIQNGGNYGENRIVIFESRYNGKWMPKSVTNEWCELLGLEYIKCRGSAPLERCIDFVRQGVKSDYFDGFAEGLICRPSFPLYDSYGERIVCKIKHKDFYGV